MGILINAVYGYMNVLPQPGKAQNVSVVRSFLVGNKRRTLQQELIDEGSTKAAAEAQVRRWANIGTGKQARGAENIKASTRFKLIRIILKRAAPVLIKVSGTIGYESDMRRRAFTVDTVILDDLLAMLICFDAGYTQMGSMYGEDGNQSSNNVFTGCYFDTHRPRLRNAITDAEDRVITSAPYDNTLIYEDDCLWTITKQKKGGEEQ